MGARGKFGEHERSVRVARGVAESNSSFLSALQSSQVHLKVDIRTAKSSNQFFYNIVKIKQMIPGKQVLFLINYKILCTKKKRESGFSYRFNLNMLLNFDKLL